MMNLLFSVLVLLQTSGATQPAPSAATQPTSTPASAPVAAMGATDANPLKDAKIAVTDGAQPTLFFPPDASLQAQGSDWTFMFIWYVSLFFLVLISILLVYFVFKYRRRYEGQKATSNITHNTPLELAWTILPLFLVIYMFWLGFKGFVEMTTPPADSMEIRIRSQKWSWEFTYPSGLKTNELHVPLKRNVKLTLSSDDVLHSFYVPAFRIKRDAVPGRYTYIWFNPTQPGEYLGLCAEFCGTKHSEMLARVVVHPTQAAFEEWLRKESDIWNQDGQARPIAEVGRLLYVKRGCAGCHSVDGSKNTGPTFQGLWSRNDAFTEGGQAKTLKDVLGPNYSMEDYVRESIEYPMQKLVKGYDPVMPVFKGQISDREFDAIFEFLKTLDTPAGTK